MVLPAYLYFLSSFMTHTRAVLQGGDLGARVRLSIQVSNFHPTWPLTQSQDLQLAEPTICSQTRQSMAHKPPSHVCCHLTLLSSPYLRLRKTSFYFSNTPPRFLSEPLLYLKYLVTPYTERDKAGFARGEWFSRVGAGYYIEQSTQPQTIGYSLSDSPLGLLAWIYEKLVQWTDNYPWTDDEGLDPLVSLILPVRLTVNLGSTSMGLDILVFESRSCGICTSVLRVTSKRTQKGR